MAKDYRLILKTQLDVKDIQKQIDDLQKKIAKTNFKVNTGGQGSGSGSSSGSSMVRIINPEAEKAAMDKVLSYMQKIKQEATNMSKVKTTESISPSGMAQLETATMSYTNAAKMRNEVTFRWVNIAKEGEEANWQFLASTRTLTDGIEAQQKVMDRSIQKAKEFLEKSKLLNKSNPNVQSAMGVANQMLGTTDPAQMKILNDQLAVYQKGIRGAATGTYSFTEELKSSLRRTVEYTLSLGVLYGTLNQLRKGLQYIVDLNKQMTNIQVLQVDSASTNEEINKLSEGFNELAKSMGVTTLQVAAGSTEWLRQGKTITETQELLRSTMMLSKLGALESAQATEYLTAILNGFNMEASKAEDVVSKLVAIDNIAATSSGELATAMQYGSAIAKETGVSFESLAAYVATASSRTRLSAEMIGQAFRTMFVRMQSVKAGEIDETGMALNNVEKTLSRVGISLRDATNSFRPLEDVISDVGGVWGTLDEVTKAQISNAIAGQRQAQIFGVLMQNFGDVTKYVTAEQNSLGLATDRYSIYLKSVEAAQNRVTSSWESLVQSTVSSGMVAWFYNLAAGSLNFMESIGGIPAILGVIISSLIAFNGVAALTALGIDSISGALVALQIAFAANPLGFIVLGLGAAVLAFNYFYETSTEKLRRLNTEIDEFNSNIETLRSDVKSISELSAEFKTLSSDTSLTADETQRLVDVQNQLKELVPELSGQFDEYGNFIVDATQDMSNLSEATLEQIKLKNQLKQALLDESAAIQAQSLLDSQSDKIRTNAKGGTLYSESEKIQINLDWSQAVEDSKVAFEQMSDEGKKAFIKALEDSGDNGKKLANDIFTPLLNKIPEVADAITEIPEATGDFVEAVSQESQNAFEDLVKQVVNMLKDIKKQEKENIQQQLSDYKEYIDTLKQGYKDRLDEEKRLYDIQKTNLQRQHEDEKRINDDRIDAIKDELDGYKKILNARQELLKLQKQEAEYNRTKADKESDLAKLEAQILELSFDNSADGIARRLELEQQAADLRQELANDAADHEFDLQQQALDAEIAKAEEEAALRIKELEEEQKASDLRYEMRLRELEDAQDKSQQEYDTNIRNLENTYAAKEANFQNQIKLIDNYLSQEGLLNKQAMDLILDENSGVYEDLMEWNRVYGTGIKNDIIAMWDLAKVAVDDYKNAILEIPDVELPGSPGSEWDNHYVPTDSGMSPVVPGTHHTGIEKGAVGGVKLKSSEEFIKVLRGEVVITPKQMSNYTNNILPSMMNQPKGESTFSGGGATFEKLFDIVIQGNLDKSTLPDLERLSTQIIDKINKGMQQRGMLRNTNLNAI